MEQHRAKLLELIKEQAEAEREHVKRISDLEKKVDSAAAKLLLLEMKLDSEKHSGILTGILQMFEGLPHTKTFWEYRVDSYVDQFAVKQELENHVKKEDEILAHVQKEMEYTKDEGLKLLLQHIADDEKKHHKILELIVKNQYRLSP